MRTVEMFCICWSDPSLNVGLTPGMRLDEVMARTRLRTRKPGRWTRLDYRRGRVDFRDGRTGIEALDDAELQMATRGADTLRPGA
jgi:hypothetical protein